MKTTIFTFAIASAMILSSCGGEEKKEEKKEEPKEEAKEEEKEEAPAYEYTFEVSEVDVPAGWAVAITDKAVTFETIQTVLGNNYKNIGTALGKMKKQMGEPYAAYLTWVDENSPFDMQSGYSVSDSTIKVKAPMELLKTYSGKALKITMMGDYDQMMKVYADFQAYTTEKGLTSSGAPWEVYVVDPMEEKDTTKWHTEIYFPVK